MEEYIILGFVALLTVYIIIKSSINTKKIKSKLAVKPPVKEAPKEAPKDAKVELKTVVAPKETPADLQKKAKLSQEEIMKKAALESIEDERKWKEKLQQEEKLRKAKLDDENEKYDFNKKLREMQNKLDEIDLNEDEKGFIQEVNKLSPQLRAVLLADLLNRRGF